MKLCTQSTNLHCPGNLNLFGIQIVRETYYTISESHTYSFVKMQNIHIPCHRAFSLPLCILQEPSTHTNKHKTNTFINILSAKMPNILARTMDFNQFYLLHMQLLMRVQQKWTSSSSQPSVESHWHIVMPFTGEVSCQNPNVNPVPSASNTFRAHF